MTPNCTICNSASSFLLTKDGYYLYKCPTCDLVFVHEQPKADFLKEKVYSYESGYQSNKKAKYGAMDKKTATTFKLLSKRGLSGKLLDIGCSSGEFMHHAQTFGFETFGVELNKRTAKIAQDNGLNVFIGYLKDAKFQDNFFDVVYLGDVIEHVPSPRDLIKECSRVLKAGGYIVISTPNLDCLWSRSTFWLYKIFKIPWSSVTPPHHLFQFSENNLNKLMDVYNYSSVNSFYMPPPRLMYELGSLHLMKRFKNDRLPFTFFFMIFSFILYIIFYMIDMILTPFKRIDFSMVVLYRKNK